MYNTDVILQECTAYEYILNKIAKEVKEEQNEKENTKN